MLDIQLETSEQWDSVNEIFLPPIKGVITIEHSLIALSKWESKWHKPFLTKNEKTKEETIDYIKCMTINKNVNPLLYNAITNDVLTIVNNYIYDSMTATWFGDNSDNKKGTMHGKQITSELIYYSMIALNIPFSCEKWHLNRLLTLIKVCNLESQPAKNRSSGEIMRNNAAINAARRKKYNTKG